MESIQKKKFSRFYSFFSESHFNSYYTTKKIVPVFIFLSIILELIIIILTNLAAGYELSIYTAFPWIFWVCFFSSVLLSLYLVFSSIIDKLKQLWIYGLIGIILNYTIFLLLPTIRGYYFLAQGNDDVFSHLAYTDVILQTGHLFKGDVYPASHILFSVLAVLGIPINIIANFFPYLFTILLILFFYTLGRSLSSELQLALLMVIFATPLLFSYFHYTFHPFIYALFFMPLILSCIHRINHGNSINLIIIFIFLMAIVFFHPLVTFFTIGILVIYFLNAYFLKNEYKKYFRNTIIMISLYGFIAFFTWYFSFSGILLTIKNFYDAFFNFEPDEKTIVSQYSQVVTSSQSDTLTIIINYIKPYGAITLFLIIAIVCLLYVVYMLFQKKYHYQEILFSTQLLFGIGCAIVVSFLASIVSEPQRAVALELIMGIILSAICFDQWLKIYPEKKRKIIILSGLFIIISFAIIFGLMAVYESPWTSTPSKQMTYMEKDGITWLFSYRIIDQPTYLKTANYRKMEMYVFGIINYRNNQGVFISESIPTHFGYKSVNHLDVTLKTKQQTYLITHEKMRQFILAIREDRRDRIDSYNGEDFFRLNNDNSVQSVYKNGEYEIWIIQPY
ncbi:MAG: hypothetical protein WC593_13855 [Methanoregula sp.]